MVSSHQCRATLETLCVFESLLDLINVYNFIDKTIPRYFEASFSHVLKALSAMWMTWVYFFQFRFLEGGRLNHSISDPQPSYQSCGHGGPSSSSEKLGKLDQPGDRFGIIDALCLNFKSQKVPQHLRFTNLIMRHQQVLPRFRAYIRSIIGSMSAPAHGRRGLGLNILGIDIGTRLRLNH